MQWYRTTPQGTPYTQPLHVTVQHVFTLHVKLHYEPHPYGGVTTNARAGTAYARPLTPVAYRGGGPGDEATAFLLGAE